MKIKAGQYYRTRGGKRAFVGYIIEDTNTIYRAVGHICYQEIGEAETWAVDGTYLEGEESFNDLIAPWESPKKVYLIFFGDGTCEWRNEPSSAGDEVLDFHGELVEVVACKEIELDD